MAVSVAGVAALVAIIAVTVVVTVKLTDDGPSASGKSQAAPKPNLPLCAEIWIVGAKLPRDYAGCIDRDGDVVEAESVSCGVDPSWGEEVIHLFDDGTRRYLAWSASAHNYPVEWKIEDGDRVGAANHKSVWDTSLRVCKSP